MVSDNGVQLCSDVFTKFMNNNVIHHIKTAVAKSSTNGACEHFNRMFKANLRAMNGQNVDLHQILKCFLLTYGNAMHSTTYQSPAQLFLERNIRTRLDLIKYTSHVLMNHA